MGYEQIKAGISEVLSNTRHLDNVKDDIIEVKEEVICCEKDHPKSYIHLSIGEVVRCQYCNTAYKRIE